MKEKDLVFFQPLWRRLAVTSFCAIWALIEWMVQAPLWAMIATGMTVYCYWTLIHTFPAKEDEPNDT